MKTLRRAAPLAALAALALALSACDASRPDDHASSVSVSAPSQFATSSPAWKTITDIPSGQGMNTAVSPDGKHYAYAQRDRDSGTITVGQIDLETGEPSSPVSTQALDANPSDGTNGNLSLFYSGNRLVSVHSGTSPNGESQWSAALFPVGSASDPKVLTENTASGATVKLPSADSGPIVSASSGGDTSTYVIDTETSSTEERSLEAKSGFQGCGDETNCNLSPIPAVQSGGTTVVAFKEGRSAAQSVCSERVTGDSPDKSSGFDHCMTGFMTEQWSSQDPEIAPQEAIPEAAYIYAAGDGYLVGAWRSEDGGTVYRTININEPGASHAEVTCDTALDGPGAHTLGRSPSGQYMEAGSLLFDTRSGEGRCFGEDDSGVTFASVDNSGIAWGASGSSWSANRYQSSVVSATLEGTLTPEGNQAAIPVSFVSASGAGVGVFAVADDALAGTTVVAGYHFAD